MKYGILTIHETLNYGSALQTYGLYYGMKGVGLDVEVINYRCKKIYENEFKPFRNKSFIKRIILMMLYGRKYRKKRKGFETFFRNVVNLNQKIAPYNRDTINDSREYYDCYVVGSDMVWNPEITGNDYTFFLDFVADRNKKYAFSASAGDYTLFDTYKNLLALIDEFSYVAVREKGSAKYLSEKLNRDIRHLQDPTILLEVEELERLAKKPSEEKYVLIYYQDLEGKIFIDAKRYAEERGLKPLYINIGKKKNGIRNILVASVEEFLGYVKYADAVFTSSYHGLLFSIYYNKEFWYYDNNQNSRMESVAESYGIQGRNGSDRFFTNKVIDYEEINNRIKRFRKEYISELKSCLMERY